MPGDSHNLKQRRRRAFIAVFCWVTIGALCAAAGVTALILARLELAPLSIKLHDWRASGSATVLETKDGLGAYDKLTPEIVDKGELVGNVYATVERRSLVVLGCHVILTDVGNIVLGGRDDLTHQRMDAQQAEILDQMSRLEFRYYDANSSGVQSYGTIRPAWPAPAVAFTLANGSFEHVNPAALARLALILFLPYLAILAITLAIVHLIITYIHARRARRGHCPACNYDLKSAPLAPCPECGLAFPLGVLGQDSAPATLK